MPQVGKLTVGRVRRLVVILPLLGRLAWRLARDERVPRRHRAVLVGGVAYVASPVDVAPDFLPVVGRLDDAMVLAAAVAWVLHFAAPEVVDEHLSDLGVTRGELADKLRVLLPPPLDLVVEHRQDILPRLATLAEAASSRGGRAAGAVGGALRRGWSVP